MIGEVSSRGWDEKSVKDCDEADGMEQEVDFSLWSDVTAFVV